MRLDKGPGLLSSADHCYAHGRMPFQDHMDHDCLQTLPDSFHAVSFISDHLDNNIHLPCDLFHCDLQKVQKERLSFSKQKNAHIQTRFWMKKLTAVPFKNKCFKERKHTGTKMIKNLKQTIMVQCILLELYGCHHPSCVKFFRRKPADFVSIYYL